MNAREGERGRGLPRSNEEQRERHEKLYPGTSLPERGTGLSEGEEEDKKKAIPWIVGAIALTFLFIVGLRKK